MRNAAWTLSLQEYMVETGVSRTTAKRDRVILKRLLT
jgi:hypothetical protein